MYINLIVTPDDKTMAWIQWARIGADPVGQTNTDWSMAFVDRKWDKHWSTRLAQGPNWFGIETMQGSSARLALERAEVLEGGARNGAPNSLYFLGPWDRGVWITRNPGDNPWEPQATVGVINGQFRNTEKDDNKEISLDLKWKQSWGMFGFSWMNGRWVNDIGLPTAPASSRRDAALGCVRYERKGSRWDLQGEYVDGKLLGSDIEGWYTQLEYDPTAKGAAYVKYEKHDPAVGVPGNTYDCWHVGYAHQMDANNELTLQFDQGTKGCDLVHPDRTAVGFQWQFGF